MKTLLLFLCVVGKTRGMQLPFLNMRMEFPSLPKIGFSLPEPIFDQQEDESMFDSMVPGLPLMNDKILNGKDIKTKNNTVVKDGYKITTINKTGPGFFSYMSEIEGDEKKGNKSKSDFSSNVFTGGDLLTLLKGGRTAKKCKKCPTGNYCDSMYGKCRKKLSEGNICMLINQCEEGLRCVYGRCNNAEKGGAGTFCKKKDQCKGDACCIRTEGSYHAMCILPLTEGAICGLQTPNSFMKLLSPEPNKEDKECSPCKSGLKCANVGNLRYKKCVQMTYVEEPKKKEADESKESDGDEENDSDSNSEGEVKKEKNKTDDNDDNDDDTGDNSGEESAKDEDDDDDDDDGVNPEENGIPVQNNPKKKKKGRKGERL